MSHLASPGTTFEGIATMAGMQVDIVWWFEKLNFAEGKFTFGQRLSLEGNELESSVGSGTFVQKEGVDEFIFEDFQTNFVGNINHSTGKFTATATQKEGGMTGSMEMTQMMS